MANMHLVTGYAGKEHVTAADQGSFNAAMFGSGQFVLGTGNQFAASVVTNNLIRVQDGDLLMQGRHVRVNEGTYVDLAIENGAQGYMRNDLIVARYTANSATAVEEVNLVVIKGANAATNPVDPSYTVGDLITDHAIRNDMPLYRVPLNGLNVGELVPLFEVKDKTILDKMDNIDNLAAETTIADADHVPFYDASATAHKKITWANIKAVLGKVFAPLSHTHLKADITNFPSSMPASDVYAWAKASTKPTYTYSEVGAAASGHKHAASDITSGILAVARGGTGVASYSALLEKLVASGACRIQTGSYVGTGTEGSANPVSVTFSFKPKLFMIPNSKTTKTSAVAKNVVYSEAGCPMLMIDALPTDGSWSAAGTNNENGLGYCTAAKYNDSTKTLSWYSSQSANQQWNSEGDTYYWIAIG